MRRFVRSRCDFLPLTCSDYSIYHYGRVDLRTVRFGRFFVHPHPFVHVVVNIRFYGAIICLVRATRAITLGVFRRTFCLALQNGRPKGVRPFSYSGQHVQGRADAGFFVEDGVGNFRALSGKISRRFVSDDLVGLSSLVRYQVLSFYALVEMGLKDFPQRADRFLRGLSPYRRLLGNMQARRIVVGLIRAIQIFPLIAFEPLLYVTSYACASRVSAQRRVDYVLFLCRVEGERVQDVQVNGVTSRRR